MVTCAHMPAPVVLRLGLDAGAFVGGVGAAGVEIAAEGEIDGAGDLAGDDAALGVAEVRVGLGMALRRKRV